MAFSAGWLVRLSIGFLTWLAAARLYPATQVGMAASAISAMLICVEVGVLGVDAALIALFPVHRERPQSLLTGAITLAAVAAGASSLVFIALAALGFRALHVLAGSAGDAVLFLILTMLQAGWWLMDQAAVAMGRSHDVPIRAGIAVTVTLVVVVALGEAEMTTAASILSAWALAALTACAVGLVQIARSVGSFRFRPRLARRLSGTLLSVGMPNCALTAADIAPGLILPIVAAQALSARAAAFWYTVWMMAFAAYTVPLAFGLHLFAEVAATRSELIHRTRRMLRAGLGVAAAATIAVIVLGPLILSILGPAYASHGTTALRLAALAAVPMVVMKAYLFVCRGIGRVREATTTAAITGAAAVGLAAVLAPSLGLPGIAVAWLAVQSAGALVAGIRLRVLVWRPTSSADDVRPMPAAARPIDRAAELNPPPATAAAGRPPHAPLG